MGHVEEGDYVLGMSKEYIENLLRNQKQPGGPLKGGKNLGSFSGGFDIEEDIMGDLCWTTDLRMDDVYSPSNIVNLVICSNKLIYRPVSGIAAVGDGTTFLWDACT